MSPSLPAYLGLRVPRGSARAARAAAAAGKGFLSPSRPAGAAEAFRSRLLVASPPLLQHPAAEEKGLEAARLPLLRPVSDGCLKSRRRPLARSLASTFPHAPLRSDPSPAKAGSPAGWREPEEGRPCLAHQRALLGRRGERQIPPDPGVAREGVRGRRRRRQCLPLNNKKNHQCVFANIGLKT